MGPTVKEIEDRQASLARGEKDSTHSMLIVGFGTDEDGQDYYLVQNSWGEGWGYHGYGKIKCSLLYNLRYPIAFYL
ncbi:hypothetical protein BC332_34303 [Capsicum chinense]|nr:hypothetical protein BC332_34303 [Capsicum chinense]